jgi:very-short-patch-repair endonuclease
MPFLSAHCRFLRRHPTPAAAALWDRLRGRRLAGFKFRRQHPCGPFVLDFFCTQRRLAVEIDGSDDPRRARFLATRRITVLRFTGSEVLREPEAALVAIAFALGGTRPPR